jgi:hypothetical protein
MSSLSINEIKNFVAAWYKALDQHVSPEECAMLVTDENLEMIFPEKTLHESTISRLVCGALIQTAVKHQA